MNYWTEESDIMRVLLSQAEDIAAVTAELHERMLSIPEKEWPGDTPGHHYRYAMFGGFPGWWAFCTRASLIFIDHWRTQVCDDGWPEKVQNYAHAVIGWAKSQQQEPTEKDMEEICMSCVRSYDRSNPPNDDEFEVEEEERRKELGRSLLQVATAYFIDQEMADSQLAPYEMNEATYGKLADRARGVIDLAIAEHRERMAAYTKELLEAEDENEC